ncbi:hypothetical protein [Lacinutrix sp. Bg11-31]|uniref:hypothetical protein n=1 Tax=Lacinutrix sp. Bg11-31 TaxID=2057808 RepID=UPI000C30104A|nr:hypothetical protein [Lacinutrix sp. Bg11-31]AUC82569.1 hypothetical protein CW733_10710 [Lacinutrix sp. Bg11-31]
MNSTKFSRFLIIIFISFVTFNCGSSDDGGNGSDVTISNKAKIIGVWYETDKCQEQNIYTFNTDLNYELLDSGNIDCNTNEFTTYKFTGIYNIINSELFFNQETDEIITQGTTLTTQDFEANSSTKYTIETLNDTNLIIKTTITSDSGIRTYSNSFER